MFFPAVAVLSSTFFYPVLLLSVCVAHLSSCHHQHWKWVHQGQIGHPEAQMLVTSPRPLNAELLWLKYDWQSWLLILILGTYAGWWAEGRQWCVPGGRHAEANSLWHAIRARSHTLHISPTHRRHLETTHTFPLMHRRGEARREGCTVQ